jgi:hypothetical protein
MQNIKQGIQDIKGVLSIAVMEDKQLTSKDLKDLYSRLRLVEGLVDKEIGGKESELRLIPNLPKGYKHNPYPRLTYIFVCQKYSNDQYFTMSDLVDFTGASRNQVKMDIERLESEGHIQLVNSYTAERSTKYYKYRPTKL